MKKAKKATAGEKHVAWWTSQTLRELRNDPTGKKEAEKIDRLIAAAVRKREREILSKLECMANNPNAGHQTTAWMGDVQRWIAATSRDWKPAKNGANA